MQIFPKTRIRFADHFRTEGGGRKGERHAVVVVGVDGGCRSVDFERRTCWGEGR